MRNTNVDDALGAFYNTQLSNKITPDDTKYLITSYFFDDEISDQLMSYGINRDNIIKINDLIL